MKNLVSMFFLVFCIGSASAGSLHLFRWATHQGGMWSGMEWRAGHFNQAGDSYGRADFAKVFDEYGQVRIDVHKSNGSAMSMYRAYNGNGLNDPMTGAHWVTGDFDGNGLTDFLRVPHYRRGVTNVTTYLYLNNGVEGAGQFTKHSWFGISEQTATETFVAGDFDGDGVDEFARVHLFAGKLYIDAFSVDNPSPYRPDSIVEYYQGNYTAWGHWVVGDFNGDGIDDIGHVFNDYDANSIDIFEFQVSGNDFVFAPRRYETRGGGYWPAQKWMAMDGNGDGLDDLVNAFDCGAACVDIHYSTGSTMSWSRWVTGQGGFWYGQLWAPGDFNGDGKEDLGKAFYECGAASIDVHLNY